MNLTVDEKRMYDSDMMASTGIYVRAVDCHNNWHSCDINVLDKPSLLRWLKSRGGDNQWAESVVCVLLGHEQ